MIKRFRHSGLENRFNNSAISEGNWEWKTRLVVRLDRLNVAQSPKDMDLPGWHLQELKGNRAGTWAINVTHAWRITFTFEGTDVTDVDLENQR